VGVARLPLDAVGQVEGHARALALERAGHELLKVVDEVLVPFQRDGLVAGSLERVDNAIDGLDAVLLAVWLAEEVDDLLRLSVVDDGDLHGASRLDWMTRPAGEQFALRIHPASEADRDTTGLP
jgi:hypothetical protein